MSRQMRLTVSLGYHGANRETEIDLPDNWDDMSEDEQNAWAEEEMREFRAESVESWFEVIGDES